MASAIGLDIGSSAVRAVQLSGGRGTKTLDRLGQVLLPTGAVRDGEIIDADAVVDALQLLWKQYKFKGRKVAVGVANQQVVVRQVDLPTQTREEFAESLPYQVQDFIPIPVEQAQLDFEILGERENADGTSMSRLLLVAAAKDMVDEHLAVLDRAKLQPVVMDLDPFAVLRALVDEEAVANADPSAGDMIINVGATVTNVVVHSRAVPRFVRILLMGGSNVTEGLVNNAGLSFEDAEAFKANPSPPPGQAAQVVTDRSDRFIAEIRGSLDYYRAQNEAIGIQRVVLTGGGSLLPGLGNRLAQGLRLPVDRGHPMQLLKIGDVGLSPEQLGEAESFLSVAIGLALGALES